MSQNGPTFVMKSMDTFSMKVELAIPPENPIMRGFLTVDAYVKSKAEFRELADKELEDGEYFDAIVHAVHGLGDANGNPIEGEDAIREVKEGKLSMYYLPAIVTAYFEQYGEARRKNSKRLPRR